MRDRANDGVATPQLVGVQRLPFAPRHACEIGDHGMDMTLGIESAARVVLEEGIDEIAGLDRDLAALHIAPSFREILLDPRHGFRSEEHTSELQSLMRISYAVFCLKKKTMTNTDSIIV